MEYWNDDYQVEVDSISRYLKNNFEPINAIQNGLDTTPDNKLVDTVILLAWQYFERTFINRRDLLNKYTKFNQKHLEERGRPMLETLEANKLIFLSNLLRVIYEYYFWVQDSFRAPVFMSTNLLERLDKLVPSSEYDTQFIWIERSLPSALTMDMLTSPEFKAMKVMANDINGFEEKFDDKINKGLEKANEKIENYKKEIKPLILKANQSQKSLSEYEEKLTEYKNDYNFVLLSKAFSNLLQTKRSELSKNNIITSRFFKFLALIPLLVLINHIFGFYKVEINIDAIAYYLPILSLEVLIFYYMRLYYIEGRTIKTQILQIEQRLSLCEFIHDYVDTKNRTGADKDSWSLFEKLIFSPIQLSSENIPSLLDGASAVADVVGKVIPKEMK
ncbi:hypothetical protein [Hafnia sp.]|uniref:hypothetical protein n=1 Tax=Hafnia sp. TaxID=1873498 RepID=UPI002FC7B75A